jgi:hypothetical protein
VGGRREKEEEEDAGTRPRSLGLAAAAAAAFRFVTGDSCPALLGEHTAPSCCVSERNTRITNCLRVQCTGMAPGTYTASA